MENAFGTFVRNRREEFRESHHDFSVCKVERCEQPPPSEAKIAALAEVLDEDADVLLAIAGKVSNNPQEAIKRTVGMSPACTVQPGRPHHNPARTPCGAALWGRRPACQSGARER